MDIKQYLIVDLEKSGDKKMFVTEQVDSIVKDKHGLWEVKFSSSSRIFHYNPDRLLCLKNPIAIDLEEKGLYINSIRITNVAEILQFSGGWHTYYHVTYQNGYYDNFDSKEVYITRTRIDRNGGSCWDYLKKLADETGLMAVDEESILSKQYELVDVKRDTVPLAQYLGDKSTLNTFSAPKLIYYPFSCNASQKLAVEAALTHQVSIIQGPPGTGKTQTILNIIANLLMMGKTVLVVSNNNSAVENVAEKLAKENLDFLVAKLGSVENKEAFVANQVGYPSMMKDWIIENVNRVEKVIPNLLQSVSQGFDIQTNQAKLKADYDALLKEIAYHRMLGRDGEVDDWLKGIKASQLLKLTDGYKREVEHKGSVGWWFRLSWALVLGWKVFRFLKGNSSDVILQLERAYYSSYKSRLESDLSENESALNQIDVQHGLAMLSKTSLRLLKHKIAGRYIGRERKLFEVRDIKPRTEEFLKEYPVVLSTTYSAKSCISKMMVFDYVIMDEASQVDIKTGALALSCAKNAVIVGDDKQLPNVVSNEEKLALEAIQSTYHMDDRYNAATHSFLQSCLEVFKDAPVTLLREHYRCHPKIIEFCNRRFYDGELVTMTKDNNEPKVLEVVRTVKGNHARGHFNQREIDVILQEVLPEYAESGTVGIITPYKVQAQEINRIIGADIASTVHKYQGRECDTIIMSMVDNEPTEFSDDPNLMNVAISRAKKHLCIVATGNEMNKDSNLSQLIDYVQYNNFEVKESKLHSVFDLLYKQYTAERLEYESKHAAVSEHLSENLLYDTMEKAITKLGWVNINVLCHYPLSRLIGDWDILDERERAFAESPLSHVDFLLYNTLTKQPRMVVEVDGWHFHKESEVQQSRDVLKNQILGKIGLCIQRISTTDTVSVESMQRLLQI